MLMKLTGSNRGPELPMLDAMDKTTRFNCELYLHSFYKHHSLRSPITPVSLPLFLKLYVSLFHSLNSCISYFITCLMLDKAFLLYFQDVLSKVHCTVCPASKKSSRSRLLRHTVYSLYNMDKSSWT